jgi:hypothetical protein
MPNTIMTGGGEALKNSMDLGRIVVQLITFLHFESTNQQKAA